MARGYEVLTKDFAGQWTPRLIENVTEWLQDPDWPERSLGWVRSPATEYVRPVRRLAGRSQRANGQVVCAVLICLLSAEQMLAVLRRDRALASHPGAELQAYIDGYDQRGGGIETSIKGDKQGLGLTTRTKKRFEAQQMLLLLCTLAHNVLLWARQWLSRPSASGDSDSSAIGHYGLLRLVRDGMHISGHLRFDSSMHLVEIVLNQQSRLARSLSGSLQALLAPSHVVVILGEIWVAKPFLFLDVLPVHQLTTMSSLFC